MLAPPFVVRLVVFALLAALTGCSGADGQEATPATAPSAQPSPDLAAEVTAIEATWMEWTAAVAANDNVQRAELVADSTLAYYDRLRDLALTAPETELRGESLKDQLTVYELRAGRVPVDVLRTAEGRQLYLELLNTSVVVQQATKEFSPPDVRAADVRLLPNGVSAFSRLVGPGGASSFQMRFEREDGRWRVDVSPLLTLEADRFRLETTDATTSGTDFLDATLPELYGGELAQKVRQPLGS